MDLADNDDWRLPNIRELISIVDDSRYNPAIDPVFQGQSTINCSATTLALNTGDVWVVVFNSGGDLSQTKTLGCYARCVRDGLSGSFELSVRWVGSGSGTVNFNPPDKNCTSDCSLSYSWSYSGSSAVTLTATADSGSSFIGWSGGGCIGTDTCTVTMASNKSVTARFVPEYQFPWTMFLPAIIGGQTVGEVDVTGTWVGTYSTSLISSAQVTYILNQSGTDVTGTYSTSTDVGGTGGGTYNGTLSGNFITFTLNQTTPECQGRFSGTATVSGDTMNFVFEGSDCAGYHANGKGSAWKGN